MNKFIVFCVVWVCADSWVSGQDFEDEVAEVVLAADVAQGVEVDPETVLLGAPGGPVELVGGARAAADGSVLDPVQGVFDYVSPADEVEAAELAEERAMIAEKLELLREGTIERQLRLAKEARAARWRRRHGLVVEEESVEQGEGMAVDDVKQRRMQAAGGDADFEDELEGGMAGSAGVASETLAGTDSHLTPIAPYSVDENDRLDVKEACYEAYEEVLRLARGDPTRHNVTELVSTDIDLWVMNVLNPGRQTLPDDEMDLITQETGTWRRMNGLVEYVETASDGITETVVNPRFGWGHTVGGRNFITRLLSLVREHKEQKEETMSGEESEAGVSGNEEGGNGARRTVGLFVPGHDHADGVGGGTFSGSKHDPTNVGPVYDNKPHVPPAVLPVMVEGVDEERVRADLEREALRQRETERKQAEVREAQERYRRQQEAAAAAAEAEAAAIQAAAVDSAVRVEDALGSVETAGVVGVEGGAAGLDESGVDADFEEAFQDGFEEEGGAGFEDGFE